MSRESPDSSKDNFRTRPLGSRRRRKSGFSTVIGAAIMIGAISILGSAMLIWANSIFGAQQRTIGNTYTTNSNLLKETFMVEDVWLSKSPVNYVNVTIRNIGDIAINATQVQIQGLKSDGTNYGSPAKANAKYCGASCGGHYSFPLNSNGLISTKQTLRVDVSYLWNDPANIKSLNIQITTARGSIQTIVWQVA